MHLIYVVILWR